MSTTPRPTTHGGAATRGAVGGMAGVTTLVRLILRRDRVRLPVWILAIVGTVVGTAASYTELFTDEAELAARIALLSGNPASIALTGPGYGLDTVTFDALGPLIVTELSATTIVLMALMSLLLTVRHTRTEEENGRAELLRAGALDRRAATAATLAVMAGTNVALGALITLGMSLTADLPAAGSLAFGASMAAVGLVFTAVALVTAQIAANGRGAAGLAGAVLGLAFALRMIGDVGDGTLSWLSPLGWAQETRPYAGERWWPLLLMLTLAAALTVLAFALSARRDLDAGILRSRPGAAGASRFLAGPLGLAARLQRAGLLSWGAGLLVGGMFGGALAAEAETTLPEIDVYESYFDTGGDVTAGVFAFYMLFMAMLATGYAVQATLRARGEETAGRAEPVLATAVSRLRWAGGHLTVTVMGTALLLGLAGLGAGAVRAADTGDVTVVPELVGAALGYLPAVGVLIGVALALFGLLPRAASLAWAVLAYAVFVSMFGPLLRVPDWMYDLSPYEHTPRLPQAPLEVTPLLTLAAIAVALMAVGLYAFRRRGLTPG